MVQIKFVSRRSQCLTLHHHEIFVTPRLDRFSYCPACQWMWEIDSDGHFIPIINSDGQMADLPSSILEDLTTSVDK